MKQDKWTQQLHDKLAEHEMAAPEGLWADIEAALGEQKESRKSRFLTLRRWAVAASLAAIFAGGGYLWFNQQQVSSSDLEVREPVVEAMVLDSNPELKADGREDGADGTNEANGANEANGTYGAHGTHRAHRTDGGNVPTETTVITETSDASTLLAETMDSSSNGTIEAPVDHYDSADDIADEKAVDRAASSAVSDAFALSKSERTAISGNKKQASKLQPQLSLYAMNSLGSRTSSNGVLMADHLVRQFNDVYEQSEAAFARSSEPIYLSGYEERQHHHYPVSFGLTLSYPLSARLSLSSGVVYTRLSSDFTQVMRSQQIQQQQTLHYVGIPFGLSYRVWQYRRFTTYLTLWGKADWNVDTRLETEGVEQDVERDRLQWSLGGSLGVELSLLPQVGIYAEPGLSWYPDNGSHIQNYFKDKPVGVSLQVGLRVNIGSNY